MDDLTNEEQATYIAMHRHPWSPLDNLEGDAGTDEYWVSNAQLSDDGQINVWGNPEE